MSSSSYNSVRVMANPSQLLLRPSLVGAESLFRSRALLQCRSASMSLRPHWSIPESLKSTTLRSGGGSNFRCRSEAVLPESREEAIAQAAGSVSSVLGNLLKRQGPSTVKQRKQQKQTKLRVEIPVLDDTPASLVSLTLDFLSSLKREDLTVAVFFPDASSAALARERSPNSNQTFHELGDVAGPVSVVVVAGARGDGLQELARSVSPRPIVVLNPEWTREDEETDAFLGSFEAAYAFLPLAIQGFLSKTEGAVLKNNVQSGSSPWLIFVKQDGKYTRLASLQRRPGPAELESALYNAMAANSPVSKSIKFLRGLVSKE